MWMYERALSKDQRTTKDKRGDAICWDPHSTLHISLSHVMTDNNASKKRKHASNDESAHWLYDDTPPPLTILNDLDYGTELLPMPPSSQQHSSFNLFPTSRETALFAISRRRRQQRDRFNAQDREHMTNAFKQDTTIADRLIVPKIHPLLAAKLKRHQVCIIDHVR